MTGEAMESRTDTFDLELIDVSGALLHATAEANLREWTEGGFRKSEVRLAFRWPGGESSGIDWHYHAALCRVRERLAEVGLTPRCYGACRNLVLSGMAVDMGLGRRGYLVRLGERSELSDLVDIFQAGPEMDLASVADQGAFRLEWERSVRWLDQSAVSSPRRGVTRAARPDA